MSDGEAGEDPAEQTADGAPQRVGDGASREDEIGGSSGDIPVAANAPVTGESDRAADAGASIGSDAGSGVAASDGSVVASNAEVADPVAEADQAGDPAEKAGDVAEPSPVGEAPDLTDDADLDAALEALLLVVDVPAGEELLADALEQPVARVRSALERLAAGYAEAARGIDLRRVGDGWRFYTRERYAPYVERYLLDGQRSKLTRAALETLAVVAYRQPVTRSRVAAVRGVNVDGVIRTLVGRGLVEEAGTDPSTGGILYCTTELFLERLGLSSLKDLPPLAPLLPEVDAIDDV
ncbi:SMC-Scp complex subunit ScpB [Allosaccharopolyspora coralli]|uniref:SMC-Scp complex subunit ScpB n=1 Tax=Allosaccharopolyspora coralli TaxID=2665642 RepID=UPI001E3D9DF8|nr:SMC-Scp complex subunit ScpB [Allosaccharopolyspora coralli]